MLNASTYGRDPCGKGKQLVRGVCTNCRDGYFKNERMDHCVMCPYKSLPTYEKDICIKCGDHNMDIIPRNPTCGLYFCKIINMNFINSY